MPIKSAKIITILHFYGFVNFVRLYTAGPRRTPLSTAFYLVSPSVAMGHK